MARSVRLQSQPFMLQSPDPVSVTWNVIAVPGHFEGHQSGRPFDLNTKVFEEIVANFHADPLGRINVDHNHRSETLDYDDAEEGDNAPAWITALEVRGDGNLWGRWEWTNPTIVARVRAGQLRYLSPAVVFNAVHPESGKKIGAKLSSVALTNKPFLRRIPTVNATEERGEPTETLIVSGQVASTSLSLPTTDIHIPGSATVKKMEPDKKYMSFLKKMRALMEMADADGDDDLDEIYSKASGLKKAKMSAETGLATKLSEEAEALVAMRVSAGTLTDAAAVHAKAICLSDPKAFAVLFPLPAKPAAKPKREEESGVTLSSRDQALLMGRVANRNDVGEQSDGTPGASADYRTQLIVLTESIAETMLATASGKGADVIYLEASSEAKRRLAAKAVAGRVQ